MTDRLRLRFWVETVTALISFTLLVITILAHDWLEIVFGVDPDQHSGSVERLIVLVSLSVMVAAVALARREWRRCSAVPA